MKRINYCIQCTKLSYDTKINVFIALIVTSGHTFKIKLKKLFDVSMRIICYIQLHRKFYISVIMKQNMDKMFVVIKEFVNFLNVVQSLWFIISEIEFNYKYLEINTLIEIICLTETLLIKIINWNYCFRFVTKIINFLCHNIRVTSEPDLFFYPVAN